jgi:hypothetical protein
VIEQAAGLALLAALSPTALLVAAVYLGSARPRLTALFLLAPGLTERRLAEFNGWLRAHGTAIVIGVLVVAGAIMVVNGIHGLAEHG